MALLDRNYQIAAPLTTDKPKTTLIACQEEAERSLKFLKSFHMKRESNHLKSVSQSGSLVRLSGSPKSSIYKRNGVL